MKKTSLHNTTEFLAFLKTRFHLYHLSNVFFRDVQYGLMAYAEQRGTSISYGEAEESAAVLIRELTDAGILKPLKPGSWVLVYEPFRTPSRKPEAAPKTLQPAPGASTPAQGS